MAVALKPKRRNFSDDPEEFRATLGEHLDELRSRLMRVFGVLLLFATGGWFLAMPLYHYLQVVTRKSIPKGMNYLEVFHSFTEPFMLQVKMAFVIGLFFALPYAVWELWLFIRPGLKPNERRPVRILFPISLGLFLLGGALGWVMVPPTIGWFCSFFKDFAGTQLMQEQGTLVFLLIKLVMAFGIGFQLPIVTFFLTKIGIIEQESLFRSWRHSTIAIFTLSMILTPSGDPFTMLAMAVPLTVLFFGSVLAVKYTSKDKGRANEAHVLNNLD